MLPSGINRSTLARAFPLASFPPANTTRPSANNVAVAKLREVVRDGPCCHDPEVEGILPANTGETQRRRRSPITETTRLSLITDTAPLIQPHITARPNLTPGGGMGYATHIAIKAPLVCWLRWQRLNHWNYREMPGMLAKVGSYSRTNAQLAAWLPQVTHCKLLHKSCTHLLTVCTRQHFQAPLSLRSAVCWVFLNPHHEL
jgi:hypothetical protein